MDFLYSVGLQGGWYEYGTDTVTLPGDPAAEGFSDSGTFYIGMIIDPLDSFIETDEFDNSNQGEGLDFIPVNISP
jgi:hypothetical protein